MAIENQINKTTLPRDEISLRDLVLKVRTLIFYLWSKWLIIGIISLIGGTIGFFYAKSKPQLFIASTTFVLEDEKSGKNLGNLAGLASMAGVDIGSGGGIFQSDNIFQLYKSRTMLTKTLLTMVEIDGKKELLVDRYISFNQLRTNWAQKPELLQLKFSENDVKDTVSKVKNTRLRDSILGVIVTNINNNNLIVDKVDKNLNAIQVDIKAADENFAKCFNDELVKNVNEFYISTKTQKTLQNVKILQHKADSVKAVMHGAIYAAVAINDATPNLNPTRQVQRVAPVQRAQFSAETNRAILTEMVKNLELTKMSLLKETPLIQVIDEPIYPLPVKAVSKKIYLILGIIGGAFFSILVLTINILYKKIISGE
ncbi:Wzz/FepE/Etk N-terminal domain-containing protein [Pedobacter sp.]|uniref:Wzz/FepE/Etk N-terminal domain-containing protein n=1 Tax=Pedobacter sp. TaxID=1411316 RepID=UPI003BAC9A34